MPQQIFKSAHIDALIYPLANLRLAPAAPVIDINSGIPMGASVNTRSKR